MSTGYKIEEQDKLYYVTFQVVRWIDIFTRKVYRDILIESLRYCQKEKGLEIYAFVIMSNHIHLLIRSSVSRLSHTIREFKSFTAKQILEAIESETESRKEWILFLMEKAGKKNSQNIDFQLWQQDNHPIELYDDRILHQKLDYLHDNPVVAGFVEKPEDYFYSSARSYFDLPGLIDIILVDPLMP